MMWDTFRGSITWSKVKLKFKQVDIYGALQKWAIRIMLVEGKA
jgi:hypothetical protein